MLLFMKQAKTIILNALRRNVELLVFVAVVQFWPSLTGAPLNLRTLLTVGSLCVLFRFFGADGEIEKAEVSAEKEKREFVDDPEAVLEIAKLTGYDPIRRMAPYLGKWLTISGKYEGLAESLQKDAVHVSLRLNDGRRINLRFTVEHGERLRALQQGQRITAIGQVPVWGFLFSPINCELIRSERPRLAYAS